MAADPGSILPGYSVYAHHVDRDNHIDQGQFVGTVHGVVESHGHHYLHVQGGLERMNELWIPIAAVRVVVGKHVHLGLSSEELVGEAWHRPPSRVAD